MTYFADSTTDELLGQSTPGLDDVVADAVRRASRNLRVCVPAKVVNVLGSQFVDLKPLFLQRIGQVVMEYPVIPGALVCMPVGGDYRFSWALKPGDTGVLLCADRCLDAYAASDGSRPADPADARAHELTDAIFIPGLVPHAKQTEATDDMVLANGALTLRLQKGGTLTVDNGTNEMMALLVQMAGQLKTLADDLASAQVLTAMGPFPFLASSIALFQQVSATMLDVTNRLTTLQGTK